MGNTTAKGQSATQARMSAAERASKALQLRANRVPYDRIAEECGYSNRGAAYKAVQRALKQIPFEAVGELRRTELESLDSLERAVLPRALKGDVGALRTVLRVKDQRARITGLYDAPVDTGAAEVQELLAHLFEKVKAEDAAEEADHG